MTKESFLDLSEKKVFSLLLHSKGKMIKEHFFLNGYLKHTHNPGYMQGHTKCFSQVQVLGIWWLRTSGGGQPKKSETDQNWLPVNRFQKGRSFRGSKCSKRERQESGDNLGIGESAEICLSTFLALNRFCQTLDERPESVARWASMVLNAVQHVQ